MKDSYTGLQKIQNGLSNSLINPNLSSEVRQTLQEAINKAIDNINKIVDLFAPYGGIEK
jgi:hypothetical protein